MAESSAAAKKLLFLETIGELKHVERTGWILCEVDKPESVASHMYRMAVMAMTMTPVAGVDMQKVIRMALSHDMAECKIGDITPHCKVSAADKERLEMAAFKELDDILPEGDDSKGKCLSLFSEYEQRVTPEALITKDLDRFDMVLQAFQYERREYAAKGKIHHQMHEFFDEARILSQFRNEEIKSWVAELKAQRVKFYDTLPSNVADKCVNGDA